MAQTPCSPTSRKSSRFFAYTWEGGPPCPVTAHPLLLPNKTRSRTLQSALRARGALVLETMPWCCARVNRFSSMVTFCIVFVICSTARSQRQHRPFWAEPRPLYVSHGGEVFCCWLPMNKQRELKITRSFCTRSLSWNLNSGPGFWRMFIPLAWLYQQNSSPERGRCPHVLKAFASPSRVFGSLRGCSSEQDCGWVLGLAFVSSPASF